MTESLVIETSDVVSLLAAAAASGAFATLTVWACPDRKGTFRPPAPLGLRCR